MPYIALILGIITSVTGYFGYQSLTDQPETLGAFGDPFLSIQLAPSPGNGDCLTTDGTDNAWDDCGTGGGGSGLFDYEEEGTDLITPIIASTSNTAIVQATAFYASSTATSSDFKGGFVSHASSTFTATTTWASNAHLIAHGIYATDSAGLHLHANNGTEVAYFGAGGGANITFPNYTSALLLTGSGGALAEYSGTTCTNQFVRALSALGVATCATVDISDDTNLAGDAEIVLTNDTLSIASTIARDSELHDAVTLGGEDYLSLSTQLITANAINPDNLASADFGDFTCNGTTCSLDATYATSLDTAYNGGQSITADGGAVAITVPDTSNNAGLTITQSDVTNDPAGLYITSNGTAYTTVSNYPVVVEHDDDGANGSFISFFHDTVSPAISDAVGGFDVFGRDSASNEQIYGVFNVDIVDPTSGSEDGRFRFASVVNSTITNLLLIGDGILGISVGDGTNAGVVESNGNTDLTLQTGNTTTGTITITDGANGDITLAPNGTGRVKGIDYYPAFTYSTSSWSGSTTIPLGVAYNAQTWDGVKCFTDVGTVYVEFTDGTNAMNDLQASTTVGTVPLSSNNSFTAGEKRYVEVGTPASSPTKISCTVSYQDD